MRIKGKTYCAAMRTIEILNRLESQPDGIGLGALAREFGVSKKQVRRDLRVLQRAGRRVELFRRANGTFAAFALVRGSLGDLVTAWFVARRRSNAERTAANGNASVADACASPERRAA